MSVYALADLHGNLPIFNEIMNHLGPDDTLYYLGDAVDRGPNGWEILQRLLNDPRVIFIKGNHEDMMLNCIGRYNPNTWDDNLFRWDYEWETWYYNGGETTYKAFCADPNRQGRYEIIQKMKNLPFICAYHNTQSQIVYLCHAGCDDVDNICETDAIWDRSHYQRPDRWLGNDNEVIVHGHTPIPLLVDEQVRVCRAFNIDYPLPKEEEMRGAYWYANGHKCCIDCGTVWTDQAVLLNLDTWDEEIFEVTK